MSAAFRKYGVKVVNSDLSASEIYLNFLPLLADGSVELLDNKRLAAQLCGLERRTRSGGRDVIDHFPGGHDDLAVACASACVSATKEEIVPMVWRVGGWSEMAALNCRETFPPEVRPPRPVDPATTVRMIKTRAGSPDGITIKEYKEGKTYDLPMSLASVFIAEGWAEIVEEKERKENGRKIITRAKSVGR